VNLEFWASKNRNLDQNGRNLVCKLLSSSLGGRAGVRFTRSTPNRRLFGDAGTKIDKELDFEPQNLIRKSPKNVRKGQIFRHPRFWPNKGLRCHRESRPKFSISGSILMVLSGVLFTACTCVGEILCENGGEERFCSQRGVCVGV